MTALSRRIMILCRERGISDAVRHARMRVLYGVASVHDLTDEQAMDMIDRLCGLEPRPAEPDESPDERCADLPDDGPAPRVRDLRRDR